MNFPMYGGFSPFTPRPTPTAKPEKSKASHTCSSSAEASLLHKSHNDVTSTTTAPPKLHATQEAPKTEVATNRKRQSNGSSGSGNEKDEQYWERRRKNNEAAKKSRDTRRQKEDELAARALFLEQENISLQMELLKLKTEINRLRVLLYSDSPTNWEASAGSEIENH